MDIGQLFDATERFSAEFAAADTFADFAAALDASKPGIARVIQYQADKYPDNWTRTYRTFKAHGFVAKELLLPEARTVRDIFADVSLYEYQTGGRTRAENPYVRAGAAFISTSRARDFAYFGHLGADYSLRDGYAKHIKGGTYWLTGAVPTQAVVSAYGSPTGADEWDISTFEVIRWEDGRQLVTVNCHNGFGTRWLAVLDAGETALSMLDDHERGEIEAEKARQIEAWGEAR
jgi:hypothetical protein